MWKLSHTVQRELERQLQSLPSQHRRLVCSSDWSRRTCGLWSQFLWLFLKKDNILSRGPFVWSFPTSVYSRLTWFSPSCSHPKTANSGASLLPPYVLRRHPSRLCETQRAFKLYLPIRVNMRCTQLHMRRSSAGVGYVQQTPDVWSIPAASGHMMFVPHVLYVRVLWFRSCLL